MTRYMMLYIFGPIGMVASAMFVVGLLKTAFESEPIDKIEEALEEVTKKRGKRK